MYKKKWISYTLQFELKTNLKSKLANRMTNKFRIKLKRTLIISLACVCIGEEVNRPFDIILVEHK